MDLTIFVLGVLFSIIGFLGVYVLNDLKDTVKETKDSIVSLNQNVAVVIKTIEYHDERIKLLEEKERERVSHN